MIIWLTLCIKFSFTHAIKPNNGVDLLSITKNSIGIIISLLIHSRITLPVSFILKLPYAITVKHHLYVFQGTDVKGRINEKTYNRNHYK